jgi:hypothetical protein
MQSKKNVMNAVKELGKDYKGQIGYFQVDPEKVSLNLKQVIIKCHLQVLKGENKIYKDMTGKREKRF